MSKTRYKIRKEQLERVVENFVMESAKKNVKTISESDQTMITKISKKYNISESEVIREMEMIRELDEKAFMSRFNTTVKSSYPKLSGKQASEEEISDLYNKAKADNFDGDVKINKSADGYVLVYVPSGEVTGKTAKLPWWKRLGGKDLTVGK